MTKNICVLGSGSWGTAVAVMLSNIGHNLKLWSWFEDEAIEIAKKRENKFLPGVFIPKKIECTFDIEKCIDTSDIIISAVPSHASRKLAKKLKGFKLKDKTIVNISKGLEEKTLFRMSEVFKDELGDINIATLSGPTHAEEVGIGIPTTCVAASDDIKTSRLVQDVFMNKNFRVYTNTDLTGVELGGALKNVIALCAGITDGLGFGDNLKAALMTRGIVEISRLGSSMGAKVETFTGLSGLGDLIVTCTSQHSRNRKAGILIGKGKTLQEALDEVKMVVEGVKTANAAYELSKKYGVEMPIVSEAYNVLFNNKDAKVAVSDLMLRNKKNEIDITMFNN